MDETVFRVVVSPLNKKKGCYWCIFEEDEVGAVVSLGVLAVDDDDVVVVVDNVVVTSPLGVVSVVSVVSVVVVVVTSPLDEEVICHLLNFVIL